MATAEIENFGQSKFRRKSNKDCPIEFENVDFKYESQNETLTNINFKVNPSQWVQFDWEVWFWKINDFYVCLLVLLEVFSGKNLN